MEKIKVYLQYPWRFPDSPYYKYLIESPPKGVTYMNIDREKGAITNRKKIIFLTLLKKYARRILRISKMPLVNAYKNPAGNYDLIHCAHCLSKGDRPWVADIECFWSMFIGDYNSSLVKKKVLRIIKRDSCKKILPWTEKVYKELIDNFPDCKNKFQVLYPAVPSKIDKKEFNKEDVVIIFFSRFFYYKGGLHALHAMDRLTKKYSNVKAIIISDVPNEIKKEFSHNKKIKIYDILPQEKVFELCKKSDIFLYPGYTDSFGFGFLEAMSFGLPVVTIDGDSRREIVTQEKTGFIIPRNKNFNLKKIYRKDSKIIYELSEKTSILIENKNLLKKMSMNCIEEIKNGKFSIKERNKKLGRIYKEAIK